jgi:hypothetical protein
LAEESQGNRFRFELAHYHLFRFGFFSFAFFELGGGGVLSIRRSASSNLIPCNEMPAALGIEQIKHF